MHDLADEGHGPPDTSRDVDIVHGTERAGMTDTTHLDPEDARRPERSGGGAPAASVDYEFAKRTGRLIVNPGPQVTSDEAATIVADLRAAAAGAVDPVAETSALTAPAGAPDVLVVDRAGWISANVDSFRSMLDPVVDKLNASKKSQTSATAAAIGGKVTGAEMGGLLAFLSSKVLGQYDLAPGGTPRLLLVAPNIVAAERRMEVDPTDFRRWVAMHEETHRVQFTAVPWLRDHMVSRTQALAVDLAPTPEDLSRRFEQLTKNLPQVLSSGEGIGQLFATPEQKAQIAELTAVMSLLEGHADVVMDAVGPRVIPSVDEIRRKFDQRRNSSVGVDRLLRKLLGLEAKMRQYRDGAVFVRAVTDQVGRDGFNAVWSSPETLPRAAEILDPDAWVRRVHA
ncbi:zinc-dependent metalloprotease [Terrabacter ginsenosidimutans]|uniref:Zinc-dependent metalloprotease n=2 Tax=Terrabacter ginsenosidimutans TaxID=490575 RepID=A0ABP7E7H9_9MICO